VYRKSGIIVLAAALIGVVALVAMHRKPAGHVVRVQSAAAPVPVAPAAHTGLASGVPLADQLFVDPASQAADWIGAHPGDARVQDIRRLIADEPTAKWFGAWSGDIESAVTAYATVASTADRVPVMVAYDIPSRDCGGQSAGGQRDEPAYEQWINGFAAGLGNHTTIVILEPDALAELDSCLDGGAREARLQMLSYAVKTLGDKGAWVYLDAGHANWVPADQMAERLGAADVADAHGFALNVANYDPLSEELGYATTLDHALGTAKPFVIDTSRDGGGTSDGSWCNPADRRIGPTPQSAGPLGMLLWVKAPGESDGDCGVGAGTTAGQFSPTLAEDLITGSSGG
jgi:endoglucanase